MQKARKECEASVCLIDSYLKRSRKSLGVAFIDTEVR